MYIANIYPRFVNSAPSPGPPFEMKPRQFFLVSASRVLSVLGGKTGAADRQVYILR